MEEDLVCLSFEGAIDVARWTCRAWESGHFDWNLIAGSGPGIQGHNDPENVSERWRVVRWWNDQHLLDGLDEDRDLSAREKSDERELTSAIMFALITSNLRDKAEREKITPQEWMDISLSSVPA